MVGFVAIGVRLSCTATLNSGLPFPKRGSRSRANRPDKNDVTATKDVCAGGQNVILPPGLEAAAVALRRSASLQAKGSFFMFNYSFNLLIPVASMA